VTLNNKGGVLLSCLKLSIALEATIPQMKFKGNMDKRKM